MQKPLDRSMSCVRPRMPAVKATEQIQKKQDVEENGDLRMKDIPVSLIKTIRTL